MEAHRKTGPFVVLYPVFGFLTVFIAGFGMMNCFWHFGSYDSDLRGLYSYLSATWGDALCLPLIVASGIAYIHNMNSKWKEQIRLCVGLSLASSLIAFVIQLQWLISDETQLNWTIPVQHTFNAPGFYHGVFFIVMFGVIAFLLTAMFIVRKKHPNLETPGAISLLYYGFWFSGALFLFLLALDDAPQTTVIPPSLLSTIAFSGGVIFLYHVFSSQKKSRGNIVDLLALVMALISSLCAALLIKHGISLNSVDVFLVIACALAPFSFFTDRVILRNIKETSSYLLITFCTFFFVRMSLIITGKELLQSIILISLSILSALALGSAIRAKSCKMLGLKEDRETSMSDTLESTLLVGSLFCFYYACNVLALFRVAFIDVIVLLAIVWLAAHKSRVVFENVKITEESMNPDSPSDRDSLKAIKGLSYACIASILLASFLVLLAYFSISHRQNTNWFWNTPGITNTTIIGMLILVISSVALVFLPRMKPNTPKSFCACVAAIGAFSGLYIITSDFRTPLMHSPEIVFFAIFPVIGSSLFVAEGFYSNLSTFRGVAPTRSLLIQCCLIFVGNCCVLATSVLPSQSPTGNFLPALASPLLGFLGMLFAMIIVPFLLAKTHSFSFKQENQHCIVFNSPTGGILQDGFLAFIIALLAGLFALHYLANSIDLENGLSNLFAIAGTLSILMVWPLKNNSWHLRMIAKKAKSNWLIHPEREEKDRVLIGKLHRHLLRQNIITCIAMGVFALLILIGEACMPAASRSEKPDIGLPPLFPKKPDFDESTGRSTT